jgi:CheY-like chemotaxis protein
VFWNLLKNAVKFTPEGGTLTVRSGNTANESLRLEVADSGIGIRPAAREKIFNAFEQAGSGVTKAFGGLGLGLAICKALVEMHGGRIWAESDGQDHGATFVVELPTVAATAAGEGNAPASGAPTSANLARRLAILIVEDHESTAKILAKLLRAFGHDVSTAGSVQEATREAGKKPFDLLISDLGLPDGSGVDLLGKLRKIQPAVKGIALSGYGMEEDVRKTTEAGFAAHLIKPVALQQLKQAIADVAGQG